MGFVEKVIILSSLILLGLFIVFVFNNNFAKPEPAKQQALSNLVSATPFPSSLQTLNSTSNTTSSAPQENIKATKAIIKTTKGNIELALYPDDAPNTVKNFATKAQSGFYDNLVFHRVEDWVIQGGDPLGNGTGGGKMSTELNNKPFVVGSLGVARGGDIKVSNDAQFFIVKTDASWLNGQYTNFGIVTKGMDVVRKIEIGDKILDIQTMP